MRVGSVLATVIALTMFLARTATATASVRVRAPIEIDAHASRRDGSVQVRGVVKDDLGAGVAHLELRVSARTAAGARPSSAADCFGGPLGAQDEVVTKSDDVGRFCLQLVLPEASATVHLVARASERYAASESTVELDATRATVSLKALREPRVLALDGPAAEFELVASSEGDDGERTEAGLAIALEDERSKRFAQARTDASGHVRLRVDPEQLDAPGEGTLIARFEGDARLAPSVHSTRVRRDARVRLDAEEQVRAGVPEDGITLPVRARTAHGGVASGTVEALDGERVVGAATLRDGRAALRVTFAGAERTEAALRVRYTPDVPWLQPDAELLLLVPLETPSPLRHAPWVVGAIGTIVWILASRKRTAIRPAVVPTARPGGAGVEIVQARPRSQRPASLRGRVVDAHTTAPVPQARVAIARREMLETRTVAATTTNADGGFALDASQAKDTDELRVEAPLHALARHPLPAAHEVTVALVSRRRAVLDGLVQWATTRRPRASGHAREPTPAEVAQAHDATEPDVGMWARAVEEVAFGADEVDATRARQVDRLDPRGRPPRSPGDAR